MASSWGNSWSSSWANSWGTVDGSVVSTAHPVRRRIKHKDTPEEPKRRKLKIKKSLRDFSNEQLEEKLERVEEKLAAIQEEREPSLEDKVDSIGQQLRSERPVASDKIRAKLEQQRLDLMLALELRFEMELQRKRKEQDIIYVVMTLLTQ